MRPDEDRCANRQRFDQVLTAEWQQAPADECDVGRCVVTLHLPHRVAEDHADVSRNRRTSLAAPDERHAARGQELGDAREALWMPWHEQQQGIAGQRSPRQRFEQQRLFAVASARGEPDRARLTEASAKAGSQLQRGGRDRDVELEVARDDRLGCSELRESRCVCRRLCGDAGEATQHRADQRLEALVTTRGALGEPTIDQEQRHARRMRGCDQVGPQLGFKNESGGWSEMRVERMHRKWHVVGQPCLDDTIPEQSLSRFTARRGHVSEQERGARIRHGEPLHERCRGARLADRDRMDPVHRTRHIAAVVTETFADLPAVTRLLASAPPQA